MTKPLYAGLCAARVLAGATLGFGIAGAAFAQQGGGEPRSRSPFEAGFEAGIADERRGGSVRPSSAGSGLHWNDALQAEPMERLELARILLREVLVMLQQSPPGERRDRAMEQARQALVRAQNAMTWLPPSGDGEDRRARRGISLEHGWGERASGGPEG
jgi:hypothetical protein